jgi:hypothetical protein
MMEARDQELLFLRAKARDFDGAESGRLSSVQPKDRRGVIIAPVLTRGYGH